MLDIVDLKRIVERMGGVSETTKNRRLVKNSQQVVLTSPVLTSYAVHVISTKLITVVPRGPDEEEDEHAELTR